MSTPTVSVILPVYNGENYLRLAVDSVLRQTFQDYELIVIDDGSVDSTPAIASEYGDRVRYVRQENTGVAGAFNHGLRLAAGRYISWLSHDDVFLPTKLEKQVHVLSRMSAPAVCYTDIQMIDGDGRVIDEQQVPEHDRQDALRHVLTGGDICSASYSLLYDRRCIEEVGMYSETWRYTQDVDMLAKLARNFQLIRVPEVLMQVREHANRGVRSKNWEREAVLFFRERLNDYSLDELFPELGVNATPRQRAKARRWMADTLAFGPYPYYRAGFSLYRRVLRENPPGAVALLPRIARLAWRHFRQHANRQNLMAKLTTSKQAPDRRAQSNQ
jgi:glycosyltransferase involved in cell wall biosynthesis